MNRYFAENSYLLDVQSEMQIGIWTIELLEDGTYVMYADHIMQKILSVDSTIPPRACYEEWSNRIFMTHTELVHQEMQRAMAGEEVEVVYPWVSPEKGLIYVRVGARRDSMHSGNRIYGYCHDITKKITSDERNSYFSRLYQNIIQTFGILYQGIYVVNYISRDVLPIRSALHCNISEHHMLTVEKFISEMAEVFGAETAEEIKENIASYKLADSSQTKGKLYSKECCMKSGKEGAWFELIICRDTISDNENIILAFRDISTSKKQEVYTQSAMEQLKAQSNTDMLTGIHNRRFFEKRINLFLEDGCCSGAFLMLDLDNFKSVNDTFGHTQGDLLLMQTADILRHTCRNDDVVARFGGDEFAIFLQNVSSEGVIHFCNRLMHRLRHTYDRDGKTITVSASIGVALCVQPGISFKELYRRADKALYCSKAAGKGRATFYEDEDCRHVERIG